MLCAFNPLLAFLFACRRSRRMRLRRPLELLLSEDTSSSDPSPPAPPPPQVDRWRLSTAPSSMPFTPSSVPRSHFGVLRFEQVGSHGAIIGLQVSGHALSSPKLRPKPMGYSRVGLNGCSALLLPTSLGFRGVLCKPGFHRYHALILVGIVALLNSAAC